MNTDIIMVGVNLMFIGMGTVFLFLMIMIFAMNLSHKLIEIINKYYPEETINIENNKTKKQNTDLAEIALAIACALKKKENKNERR